MKDPIDIRILNWTMYAMGIGLAAYVAIGFVLIMADSLGFGR